MKVEQKDWADNSFYTFLLFLMLFFHMFAYKIKKTLKGLPFKAPTFDIFMLKEGAIGNNRKGDEKDKCLQSLVCFGDVSGVFL